MMRDAALELPSGTRSDEELIFEWITEDDISNITPEKRAHFVRWSRTYENLRLQGNKRWQPHKMRKIQSWKDKIIAFTNRRKAEFSYVANDSTAAQAESSSPTAQISAAVAQPAARRAFGIAELRENVLCRLDVYSQLSAWRVSSSWHGTIEHIFQSDNHNRRLYDPVEYGDAQISGKTPAWLQPSFEELENFAEKVCGLDGPGFGLLYAPARLSQAIALTVKTIDLLHTQYARFWAPAMPSPYGIQYDNTSLPVPQWLDFTQFQLAPCVADIFGERFQMQRGRYEVSLRTNAPTANLLLGPDVDVLGLRRCLGSTFATQPPCQTIGVYAVQAQEEPTLRLLERIHDIEGIRLVQLLETLHKQTGSLLEHWNAEVVKVQTGLKFHEPAELYQFAMKRMHWARSTATPRFVILLDKHTMVQAADLHGHYSRAALLSNRSDSDVLTDEWNKMEYRDEYIDSFMVAPIEPSREALLWSSETEEEVVRKIQESEQYIAQITITKNNMRDQNKKMSSVPEITAVGQKHDPSIKNPLVNYGQLPEWRQENQYIVSKYRSARNSYRQSIKSLTYLHNETGNIYTHLLFLVIVLLLTTYNLPQLGGPKQWFPSPCNGDLLALSAFLGGVVLCMSFSVTYHIVLDHSESVATAGKQLDFAGITCLIWGSLIATLYYTFTCEVELMRTYMLVVS
ncbi:hypothetical protein J4E81_001708 [Alternaria sp. BMP 2799]|nr:hypothetical protein J4E81_001708 [Alternaria sp. BMP 2799]